jgi:hypothetical protein
LEATHNTLVLICTFPSTSTTSRFTAAGLAELLIGANDQTVLSLFMEAMVHPLNIENSTSDRACKVASASAGLEKPIEEPATSGSPTF